MGFGEILVSKWYFQSISFNARTFKREIHKKDQQDIGPLLCNTIVTGKIQDGAWMKSCSEVIWIALKKIVKVPFSLYIVIVAENQKSTDHYYVKKETFEWKIRSIKVRFGNKLWFENFFALSTTPHASCLYNTISLSPTSNIPLLFHYTPALIHKLCQNYLEWMWPKNVDCRLHRNTKYFGSMLLIIVIELYITETSISANLSRITKLPAWVSPISLHLAHTPFNIFYPCTWANVFLTL